MARKAGTKSAEIERLKLAMQALNETPETMEDKTGVSARTISNYIWNNSPIGGPLLRALCDVFGVSVDWLMTGRGSMFADIGFSMDKPSALLPFFETVDLSTLQDFWWLAARGVEESLLQSGAVPGVDYGYVDLYQLAQPLVAEKFASGDLVLQAHEAA